MESAGVCCCFSKHRRKGKGMSINSRVDKHTVVSPHNGILRSDKHEETTDEHNDMDASQKHRAE